MDDIKSISFAVFAGTENIVVTLNNGTSLAARVIRKTDSEVLAFYAGKLISISLPDYKCEVLVSGVSIR